MVVTTPLQIPNIILAGGSSGNGSANVSYPGQLALTYQNLLSGAADIVSGAGAKVLVLTTGALGMASPVQVGNTETLEEQQKNLEIEGDIAAFCRANGIGVLVDTVLTNRATYSDGTNALTDSWAQTAAQVGLPIVGVEDVNEIGFSCSPSDFVNYASIEVNAVKTLIECYANSVYKLTANNLAVGDMAAGGAASVPALLEWWNAYNAAATQAGMPKFSFVTADAGLFAPWVAPISLSYYDQFLTALSTAAASEGMALNVVTQGVATDTSSAQFVEESEQNAIHLAKLAASGSIDVDAILDTSWNALPVGVGEISSPTSSSNEAAEIRAVYPLYETGLITAQGSITTSAPGQVILATGSARSFVPLSVQWDATDVLAGNRLGVVLIDQTGTLMATQHGSGTVSNPASNILILNGDSADLAAELGSITLVEGYVGPDTLDVESYGADGRLSDNQIAIYATAGQTVGTIAAASSAQGWLSSSTLLNTGTVIGNGSLLASETLYWSTTGTLSGTIVGATAPGQSAFVKVDAIHEPLAQYGVENAPGSLLGTATNAVACVFDPKVDNPVFETGGYANNRGVNNVWLTPLPGYLTNSFNPLTALTALTVESTTYTFDPQSGQLETSVDRLTADPITVTDLTGTHVDTFATAFNQGGTQVTETNTGNNPDWQPGWGSQFNSATLTYDGAGRLVEEFLQGGPSNPLFTIDDVFDPNNGQLWEQFQSSAQPPKSSTSQAYATTITPYFPGFDTGPVYVTQFNTGNNPNWNYVDWGTAISSDTEMWTDFFITNNSAGFVVTPFSSASNAVSVYPLQFVNGSVLDLVNIPGTINVNLNALGTVTIGSQTLASGLSGLNEIDAWGATGTVTITGLAMGGSTLIGGDRNSTIVGYGKDTIIAGAGVTTIRTGGGGSTVEVSSATGSTTLLGSGNTVTSIADGTLILNGNANTVSGSGISISLVTNGASVTVIGNGDTITAAAGSMVTIVGTADVLNFLSGGTLYPGTPACSVIVNSNTFTTWMNVAGTVAAPQVIAPRVAQPGEVILSGLSSQYIIADDNGSLFIRDKVVGRDGDQILSGVTVMAFTDGVGVFDPTGTAEDVVRLYQAALNRAPDVAGLEYWTGVVDNSNVPLSRVAGDFTASPEFMHTYGQLSDTAFVQQLYENVLSRQADAGGLQNWVGVLASGRTRGDVLLSISESPEFENDMVSVAGDQNNAEAYRLYTAALNRVPDPAGQAYWASQLANGATPTQVAQSFVSSTEFIQDYGTLNASDFVSVLYENVLHRAGDPVGQQYWTNALLQGGSGASVLVGFSDSLENRVQTAGATHANWVLIPS